MAPEASWQASSAGTRAGGDAPSSDQETVESLLRRLIQRVEESERRYDEALDELHVRLDRLSHTPGGVEGAGSPEETETLERLREQLSSLARRLEQPSEAATETEELSPLDQALSEVRAVSAGLAAAEPGLFAAPGPATGESLEGTEPAFSFPRSASESRSSASSLELPAFGGEEDEDFDKRLIDMAQRLEQSIGEAMPSTAIETLNARMDEIAARFEAALQQSPKLESLQHLERQITDMGQQLGRAEQHIARIGVIESKLQRLIDRPEETWAQMESLANKAATEAARLTVEASRPSAAERLDAIHRDIVEMNERSRVTDDRMVDTLVVMHASLKGLVQQAEPPAPPVQARPSPGEEEKASLAPPPPPVEAVFRDRLGDGAPRSEDGEPLAAFGRAKRDAFAERAGDLDDVATSPQRSAFVQDSSFDSMEDLVAAARRAARAAAARAEERAALRPSKMAAADESASPLDGEQPERRKRSILMVLVALLLMVSAALLYSRLKSKPELDTAPTATEQSGPTSTPEVTPALTPPAAVAPAPEAAPIPEAVPEAPTLELPPEAAPAPGVAPETPHPTTPSSRSGEREMPTPARVSDDAPTAIAATKMAKSAPGPWRTNILVEPQAVSELD